MKTLLTTLAFFSILTCLAQSSDPAPYCASTFSYNYNMIDQIKIKGQIQRFGAMGSVSTKNQFAYYNNLVIPNFILGDTASISINFYGVNDMEPMFFAVFIDYNRNNSFEPSELVMQNSNTIQAGLNTFTTAIQTVSKNITVPTSASSGATRMRVIRASGPNTPFQYSNSIILQPCNSNSTFGYGCSYDFNITLSSGPNSTHEVNSKTSSIYPNPSNGLVTIKGSEPLKQLTITDMLGKTVFTVNNPTSTTFDLSELPTGLYWIQYINKKEERFIEKIMITQ